MKPPFYRCHSERSEESPSWRTDCNDMHQALTDIIKARTGIRMYYVYIMTNKHNTVLYTGVTNDLMRRVYEHREGLFEGFTRRYNVKRLVYYECTNDVTAAIEREKQIKGLLQLKKIALIETMNPGWKDLYEV